MFRVPLSRWVTLFVASGFGFLLVDVGHAHHYTLGRHPWAWIPLVFAPVGMLVFLAAGAAWRVWLLRIAQAVGVAALVVGLLGAYFHNRERFEEEPSHSHASLPERLGLSAAAWAHTDEDPAAPEGDDQPTASEADRGEGQRLPPGVDEPEAPSEGVGEKPGEGHHEATPEPPPTRLQQYYADRHPPLAPLSFAGLGALGLLGAAFGVRRITGRPEQAHPVQRGEA